jgi:peptidylamidoglycolate lyase
LRIAKRIAKSQPQGILMFASAFTIPARDPDYHVRMECCYDGPQPLSAVAFRVHTHTLGRLVWLDRLALGGAAGATDAAPALRRSPLLPQAFSLLSDQPGARNPGLEEGGGDPYINGPLPGPLVIRPGQRLSATCRFNASSADHDVRAGATSADEMCNLYLLFHTDAPTALGCYDAAGGAVRTDAGPLAPRPGPEERLAALPHAWAPPGVLGQAGGADLSPDGARLWLFHRGRRVWDGASFDARTNTMPASTEPVAAAAVVALDVGTGAVVSSFGAGEFLMPHGLSTDAWGNLWLTDVGLHQVFQYSASGQRLRALGAPRTPGGGADRFCKPTAAIAASDGTLFVADGYCASRVAAFSPNGTFLGEWSMPASEAKPLNVPHALALDDCAGLLHVADRENGRVLTLSGVGGPPATWRIAGEWDTSAHGLPYALARAPGGDVYALLWKRDGGGDVTLARLGDGRAGASRARGAAPEAVWAVPAAAAPHALALAAGPGGGPGLVLWLGEARPAGGSLLQRLSLGDVDICPWAGCGAALPRLRAPGVGPGYVTPAAQRRRVLATRAALVAAILLLIAAATAPAVKGARMLPGGRFSGAGGGGGGRKARQSVVGATPDTPETPKGGAGGAKGKGGKGGKGGKAGAHAGEGESDAEALPTLAEGAAAESGLP